MPLRPPSANHPAETGAVVDFWGVVRGSEDRAEISGIEYEAHRSMAEHQLKAVAKEAAETFALKQIEIRHRLGFVPAGEASLFVRVGTQHRSEAFRAGGWIVDELKKRVPIWKKPRPSSTPPLEDEDTMTAAPTTVSS
jgi:molybdopterin synthase catalytic subunit